MTGSVLMLPDWRKRNPYQDLLAGALGRFGTEVVFTSNESWLPWSRADWLGRNRLSHLHWVNPYIFQMDQFRSTARAAAFLRDRARAQRSRGLLVWTVHNLWSHDMRRTARERIVRRTLGQTADLVIVHFPEAVDIVADAYGADSSRFVVIPHGHYIDAYPNEMTRGDARTWLGIGSEERVFLFFGTVRRYKRLNEALDAFTNLEDSRVRLIIAGKASDDTTHDLIERSKRDARLLIRTGIVPPPMIQIYMQAADLVLLPGVDILTSGSAVLAMSFGKPVIAPNIPHIRFLVGDGGGILYGPEEPKGLETALSAVHRADLEAMGRQNYARVAQWSWDKVAKLTLSAYQQARENRATHRGRYNA